MTKGIGLSTYETVEAQIGNRKRLFVDNKVGTLLCGIIIGLGFALGMILGYVLLALTRVSSPKWEKL